MDFRIPTKFSVGGLDYRVEETGSLRYGEEYGHWDGSRCLILLAHRAGGEELSEERKAQTFFHELTKDKRESPRLQSWDESASMFFLILDISDYGISRNASDRLAEIRTRP